jgi:hypothetical protein
MLVIRPAERTPLAHPEFFFFGGGGGGGGCGGGGGGKWGPIMLPRDKVIVLSKSEEQ